ncbi:hypothetical protein cypCar_00043370 [Cyprinus carpio]|nr:hypothetical protein cypCar_00043370 [Cyprinus carpio]
MADSDTCKDENNKTEVEIVPAPAAFKSDLWKHFGFAVSKNAKGEKVVDRQWTMCKHCHSKLRYNTGNTSNMRSHLTTHHPEKFADSLTKKVLSGQKTLKEAFSTTMPHNSARAQEITSSTATAVLTTKQKLLNLPVHKLIIDVVTRWNSSLDMVEHYLEQQQAVAAALLSDELRHKSREIDTSDIANAEDLVKILLPIKKATTVLCDELQPTISLISPLKQLIQDSMATDNHDSNAIAPMKVAILKDLTDRYQGEDEKFMQESSALDPRFRTLQHLGSGERERTSLKE